MQAVSNALNQLVEAGAWFARATELRIWVVRSSGDLRKPALQLIAGLEFHHDNRSAWVVLPDAHTPADHGWQARANRLMSHWEDRRRVFREREQIQMPEARLGAFASKPDSWLHKPPVTTPMRDACAAVLAAMRPPLEGFVIVLAPAILSNVNVMGSEIQALAADPALGRCRWVWVLDAGQPWPDILDRFGDLALRCECIPDPGQQQKDLDALISAPPRMIGRAGPRGVVPPRRITDPPPMAPDERAAALRQAGINPEYLEKAPQLQRLILGAAIAMKNGKGAEAVRQQKEAADLALSLRLFDVAVLCRITLATYLTAAGQQEEALIVLNDAALLAREHGLALQESQAHLAAGLLHALARRYPESADEYGASARCAQAAKMPVLAIEGWRMAGQVSLQGRDRDRACQSFREAIRVAEATEAESVKNSTASIAARKLAELCAKLDLPEQAKSLLAQAEAMESAEFGLKASPRPEPVES